LSHIKADQVKDKLLQAFGLSPFGKVRAAPLISWHVAYAGFRVVFPGEAIWRHRSSRAQRGDPTAFPMKDCKIKSPLYCRIFFPESPKSLSLW